MIKAKDIKPIKPADKLLKYFVQETVIKYCKSEDGLPKPKITKRDLESWN